MGPTSQLEGQWGVEGANHEFRDPSVEFSFENSPLELVCVNCQSPAPWPDEVTAARPAWQTPGSGEKSMYGHNYFRDNSEIYFQF